MKIFTLFFSLMLTVTAAVAQFTQVALPYAYGDLEPYIDQATMEIHYSRHHKAYVDNLNKAVVGTPFEKMNIDELQKAVATTTPAAVRNNGGGVWNHNFFWLGMAPKAGGEPTGALADAIKATWGDFAKFKDEFKKAALGRFGSGWAWLVVVDKKLVISSTPNQDNPLMQVAEVKGTPVLTIDVWEHAYYLKYQNKRADYVDNYWQVVNWKRASELYANAIK
jgi:superoxide dismutase, Fe-Mn family